MVGKWLKKRVGLILILFFCFSIFVCGQDKQDEQDKQLREEILSIYKSKGEQGLRDFVKKQKDKISNKFIVDLAEAGLKERKEEWLKACEIMAVEKNDEKTLADVLYKVGEYFRKISDYNQASNYFDKTFHVYLKLNDLVCLGNVYFSKGKINLATGDIASAIDMCDKALILFEKKGVMDLQGMVFRGKGDIYATSGNYSNAIEMYDKALTFFDKEKDLRTRGIIYLNKGGILYHLGNTSTALEMYDNALSIFEKVGELDGKGRVYLKRGDIYLNIGNNSKAIEMYDTALTLFITINQSIGIGNVYLGKGDVFNQMNQYPKALEFYDKALYYFEISDHPMWKGEAYKSKGSVYLYLANYARALEMYEKAFYFFEISNSLIGKGDIYRNKGNIFLYSCNYVKALEMYEKALEIFKILNIPISLASIYRRKGNIYAKAGCYSKALEIYMISLALFKKSDYFLGMADVHESIGTAYFALGKNGLALEMYEKALSFYKKIGHIMGQGNIYINLGDFHLHNSDYSKALEMYNKALICFEKCEEPMGQGNAYQTMGYIYFKNGKIQKALRTLEKSLTLHKVIGNIEYESFTLYLKAMVFERLLRKSDALYSFEESLSLIERLQSQTPLSEMKMSFMEKIYYQYKDAVLFMLKSKYYDKGFQCAESMRARAFGDQLSEGLTKLEKGLKTELKEERDRLVGKLSELTKQIQETGDKEKKKLLELKEEYRRVESEFDDLLIKIRLENPLYAEVNYPQPVSVKDLQKGVLKEGETLLSYFISQEKAYAFIISKDNFTVKQLKVKENEIKGLVDRYLPTIKENNINDMIRYGSLLYEKLFKPLEKYLDKDSDIIIVPMGELETIPFEALVVDKKKTERPIYLLEKYRVKYVQGATLLSILRKYYTKDNASKSFIGFGDPVYDYENFTQGKQEQGSSTRSPGEENSVADEIKEIHRDRYARAGGILNRLPQSGEEIQTIARLFEKESLKSVIHLRNRASEENAKAANMKNFAYIHFSCHGLLNDDFQSLVLSQLPPEKSSEDGYFTLNEIMNCDYNAKLVVLSACETGKGKMYKGEGVTGLTRAVMYAGTPAVVASLWKVDDRATKALMITFYKNMLEKNMDKVEALRQAKLQLLKVKTYASPYFWSPFIMYGE